MSYIGSKPADAVLETDDITDGVITTAKIADSSVTTEKIVADTNFRNIVINGDMSQAQRGTSFTSNGYGLDRFIMDESTDGAVTVSQDTTVPSGQGFATSLKVDCTTADASIGAAQYCILTTKFEGQNLQYLKYGTSSAQSLTLSFWVKSVKTGTYCVNFTKEAGGETRMETPIEYTISSASTWEKKTITLSPTAGSTTLITNSAGAIVNSNASGFRVIFTLAAGTDWHGTNNTWVAASDKMSTSNQVNFLDSTSNNFYITGVQLEAGTTASDFEFLPVDVNLQRCQRYYQFIGGVNNATIAVGSSDSTTVSSFLINYMTTMRTSPTIAQSTLAVTDNVGYDLTVNSIAASTFSSYSGRVFFNHNATATQYRPAHLKPTATASTAGITLSAEL